MSFRAALLVLPAAALAACADHEPLAPAATRSRAPALAIAASGPAVLLPIGADESFGFFSEARGIDDAGRVIGYSTSDAFPGFQPAMWAAGTPTPTALGTWRDGGEGSFGLQIRGVSPNGRYIVGEVHGEYSSSDVLTIWRDGVSEPLGGSERNGFATGVNDLGWVTYYDGAGAHVWRDGVVQDLVVPSGWTAIPTAVNTAGDVVGYYYIFTRFAGYVQRAAIWRDGVLADLPMPSSGYGAALDLNDAGQIVGYVLEGPVLRAAFWEASGLTTFGEINAVATGINAGGDVVGRTADGDDDGDLPIAWRRGESVTPLPVPPGCTVHETFDLDIGANGMASGTLNCPEGRRAARWEVSFAADNTAPIANAGGPYTAYEGAPVTMTGSGTDADGDALTLAWDVNGDGVFETTGASRTHTFADNFPNFHVVFRATDSHGASGLTTGIVDILNRPPTIKTVKFHYPTMNRPKAGQMFHVSFVFMDPGALDAPWQWTVEFGDGEFDYGSATSTGEIATRHTYVTPGTRMARITVTDKDGGTVSKTFPVVVTAP